MWDILDREDGTLLDRVGAVYITRHEVAYNRATGEVVYYD